VHIRCERHIRIATEGAWLGSLLNHCFCNDLVIVSDDAGQFNIRQHGLCWIHAERLAHKTLPLNEQHRQEIAHVLDQIWALYADLKALKEAHEDWDNAKLAQRFDQIFTHKTRFATLNQLLKRIYANKAELLKVLKRPEIPLAQCLCLTGSWQKSLNLEKPKYAQGMRKAGSGHSNGIVIENLECDIGLGCNGLSYGLSYGM
jgi:hypothetical protein